MVNVFRKTDKETNEETLRDDGNQGLTGKITSVACLFNCPCVFVSKPVHTAAGYVLKMAEEFDVLLNNHSQTLNVSDDDILGGTLLNPLHSGETEIITVRLNNGQVT